MDALTTDPGKRARSHAGIPVVVALDGLRWLAILSVVSYHAWFFFTPRAFVGTPLHNVIASSVLSFDLLFIVSGFVMYLPVAARGGRFGSLRAYALRRGARVLPAYYVCLALIVVFFPFLDPDHLPAFRTFDGLGVLTHVSVLQTMAALIPGASDHARIGLGVNGAVWTLTVEALFYVTLPLVAGAFFRRPLVGLALALAGSAAYRWGIPEIADGWFWLVGEPATRGETKDIVLRFTMQFPAYLNDFAIGMACALAYVRLRTHPRRAAIGRLAVPVQLAVVGALLVLAPGLGGDPGALKDFHRSPAMGTLVPLLLGTLVMASAMAAPRTQWLLRNRLSVRLADISYGVYLYHLPFVYMLLGYLGKPDSRADVGGLLARYSIVLALALLAGWLSYRLVERPLRQRAQVAARRISARAEAQPALARAS